MFLEKVLYQIQYWGRRDNNARKPLSYGSHTPSSKIFSPTTPVLTSTPLIKAPLYKLIHLPSNQHNLPQFLFCNRIRWRNQHTITPHPIHGRRPRVNSNAQLKRLPLSTPYTQTRLPAQTSASPPLSYTNSIPRKRTPAPNITYVCPSLQSGS